MSTALVPQHDTLEADVVTTAYDLATKMCVTSFVPTDWRKKPEEVMACVLMGRELGVPPMTALSKINVIKGKPVAEAQLLRALIFAAGHDLWFEDETNTKVTACGRRAHWPEDRIQRVTFTIDDAKAAGLAGKDNWRKWPRAMLKARASGELCRDIFADVLAGISFTVEEVDAGALDDETKAVTLSPEELEEPGTQTRKAPAKKKSAGEKAAARKRAPAKPRQTEDDGDDIVDAVIVGDDDEADVGEPAAPAEPESSSPTPDDNDNPEFITDAQHRKLMAEMSDAGFDDDARHAAVDAITDGRTQSSKGLTKGEASELIESLVASAGDEPEPEEVVEADPPPPPASSGSSVDPQELDVDGWRAEMKKAGVRVPGFIKQLGELAAEMGEDAPASLAMLSEDASPSMKAMAHDWLLGEMGVE